MERAYRLPAVRAFNRYVVVDSGAAETYLFDRDRRVDSMRVIVGSVKTKTPMMAVLMRNAKANPYWHVPPELVKSLTAAKVKEMGLGYFDQFHYEVMSDWSVNRRPVDPKSDQLARGRGEQDKPTFMVRQQPGPWNSMGAMKFEMPNDFGIYLHDTPLKEKFDGDRWISNGCVRLEDYRRFGSGCSAACPSRAGRPSRSSRCRAPVPVYMTYLTVAAGPGGVMFRPDPYGFDALAMPQMFGGPEPDRVGHLTIATPVFVDRNACVSRRARHGAERQSSGRRTCGGLGDWVGVGVDGVVGAGAATARRRRRPPPAARSKPPKPARNRRPAKAHHPPQRHLRRAADELFGDHRRDDHQGRGRHAQGGDRHHRLRPRAARSESPGDLPVQRRAGLGIGVAADGGVRAEAGRDPLQRHRRRRAALPDRSTIRTRCSTSPTWCSSTRRAPASRA